MSDNQTIHQWKRESLGRYAPPMYFLEDSPYWVEANREGKWDLYGNVDGMPNVYIKMYDSLHEAKAHAERLAQ